MEIVAGILVAAVLASFFVYDVMVTEKWKRLEIEEKQKFHSELLEVLKRGDK